jgi:hypothetical protein
LVQAAPLTDAPGKARRLMRREQHAHAVEQLDAGAYGYLVSRTALLHPNGETFDVSMGLRGYFDALTKISAEPEKDFGELVRRRRRTCGLPVAPAAKVLPFLPVERNDDPNERAAVDMAAEQLLWNNAQGGELHEVRVRLAKRRLHEALLAVDEADLLNTTTKKRGQLEDTYIHEMKSYERLLRREDNSSSTPERAP